MSQYGTLWLGNSQWGDILGPTWGPAASAHWMQPPPHFLFCSIGTITPDRWLI